MTTSRPLRDSSPNAQVFFPGAATQTKGITPGPRVAAQIGAASSQQRSQCSRDWTQAQGRFGDPNRARDKRNTPAICPSEAQTFMVGSSDSTCRFTISTQYGIDKYEFSTSCASEHLSWQNSFAPRKLGQNYIRLLGPAGSSWVPDGALEHTLSDHRSCYSYPKGTREKDCRGGESYAGKRGHLPSRPTPSSLFLQNLSSAKEGRKVQASNEPASSEQTYTVPPFQNGRYPCSSGSFADRRLDVPYRSQGRLFQHTYTPEPQKVPQVSMAASSLRVCLPTLWPFISTSCVHKDPQTSDGILQVPRGAGGDISRRSANNAPRVQQHLSLVLTTLEALGFLVNYPKSQLTPVQTVLFLGFLVNSQTRELSLPSEKTAQIKLAASQIIKDKVSARRLAQVLGMMSAAVLAIQPAPLHYRDLQALKHKALQMRGYDAEVTLSERARNDLVRWANDLDSWNGRKMREDPPVIQMETDASRSGWGGFCQGERLLGSSRESLPHKCPRNVSCLVCSESIYERCLEQDSADLIRQPVSSIPHQQDGGHQITGPDKTHQTGLVLGFSKQAVPNSSAHSGKSEHHSRLPVPLSEGQNRLGLEPGSIQGSQQGVGSLSGGSVCHTFLSSSTQIFQLEGRPRNRSDRCLHTELECDSRVCSSPMVSHYKDTPESQEGADNSDNYYSTVEDPALVPCHNGDGSRSPNSSPGLGGRSNSIPQLRMPSPGLYSQVGRLEGIRRHLQSQRISDRAGNLIIASWRPKTNANYNSAWRKWEEWCKTHNVSAFSAHISDILGFLADQFHQGKQYRSLNCYRSALSSCHLPIEGFAVGQHPLVVRLLKGVFNLRVGSPIILKKKSKIFFYFILFYYLPSTPVSICRFFQFFILKLHEFS